jgi:hypothetical protein
MKIQYKVTTWINIELDESVTSEQIHEVIGKGADIEDFKDLDATEVEEIVDLRTCMAVKDNDSACTIEWRDDNGRIIWDNANGFNQPEEEMEDDYLLELDKVKHSYQAIILKDPPMIDCFFAFNNKQFEEGIEKCNLQGKKICSHAAGLYGTREGIEKFLEGYDKRDEIIKKNCNPQDVYNYEYYNHECDYTNDDRKVLDIVERIFGENVKIKRKYEQG